MTEKKPRVNIDLKTVLVIMAFFGMGTWGSILLFAKRVIWHAVAENTAEVAQTVAKSERVVTAAAITTMRDSVIGFSERRFDRMEHLVERLPGGRKAISEVEKDDKKALERARKIGYSRMSGNQNEKESL